MKKAFTLMELIFVILVIGILSAVMIPNIDNNALRQAAQQVAADIRYTQHLALIDDRYNVNDTDTSGSVKWFKTRWQLLFSDNSTGADGEWAYTIFSDKNSNSTGEPTESEIAIDPNTKRRMTGGQTGSTSLNISSGTFVGMEKLNLGKTYGITDVAFSSSCSLYGSKRVVFDYLGRPLIGNISSLTATYDNTHILRSDCNITLTHQDGNSITITVKPETGFVVVNY